MAKFELKLPRMGESVAEATITSWLKEVGDTVELDEAVLEVATDKVDSEVPSEVEGVLKEKFFNIDDVVQVGQVIAIIETEGDEEEQENNEDEQENDEEEQELEVVQNIEQKINQTLDAVAPIASSESRFYSPLVKNIAREEGVSQDELDLIKGTGAEGRVTKNDILDYIEAKKGNQNFAVQSSVEKNNIASDIVSPAPVAKEVFVNRPVEKPAVIASSGQDEIVEMTRMGKIIAHHMVESVKTSPHVQSFIEVDVTNIWNWRNKVKDSFMKREGESLTFTPIFMQAVAMVLREYPMLNIELKGDTIIKRKNINLGMATALPDGNLIVPVIKNADQLNLVGMTKQVNDLAARARVGKLKPDDTQGGTYTVTNVGAFGTIMGTPIINQPQVGILALGAIRKMPAVIETPEGDFIGVRYKMYLSHSYDHRVVNGALGGMFIKAVKDYLEAWEVNREI